MYSKAKILHDVVLCICIYTCVYSSFMILHVCIIMQQAGIELSNVLCVLIILCVCMSCVCGCVCVCLQKVCHISIMQLVLCCKATSHSLLR